MYLSKEQLEKIKQSQKEKPLKQVMKEEGVNKEEPKDENNLSFVEALALEKELENISKPFHKTFIEEKHGLDDDPEDEDGESDIESETEDDEGEHDQNFISDNNTKIRASKDQLRSLDRKTELELEIEYEELQAALNQDIDVWDEKEHNIAEEVTEDLEENLEAYKVFIHQVKTNFGRNKSMGKMDSKAVAKRNKPKGPVGFAAKVRMKALSSDNGFSRS
ncbi:MAG: hypothetical protein ACJA0S_000150 [Rickettsiales bacterium]|jgi:hypothetical protein